MPAIPSLLERQVNALRESVRPGGRWDRLASGDVKPGEDIPNCTLCLIKTDDGIPSCSICPLDIAGHGCGRPKAGSLYDRWSAARLKRPAHEYNFGFNAPDVVALAREMKALLGRLLGEYETMLLEEYHDEVEHESIPEQMAHGTIPDPDPYDDDAAETRADLFAALEKMSDVGVECTPLVIEAYRRYRDARNA